MQFKKIKPTSIVNFIKEVKNVPNEMKKRFIDVIKMLIIES